MRRYLWIGLATLGLVGCVDEPLDHHQHSPMGDDYRTVRKGIALKDLNQGCSTRNVQGLSQQLLGEMACLSEGALVKVSHPNIKPTSNRVHLYMSPEGRDILRKAANRATIRVNSALRTINEQYMLWRGCSVAADPGTSNHETGKAIDVDNYPQVDHILKDVGFSRPLPSSDPVHYVAPGEDLRHYSVLAFQKLWNENHPGDQIAEDGKPGPQTRSRLARAPAGGFADGSACEGGGGSSYDAEMTVAIEGGGPRVETGGSEMVTDFLPGESFNAVLMLKNKSDAPIREVSIGYMIEQPYHEPVHYRIEDDHPAHDQKSWGKNDADEHPDNPPKDQLGKRGELHLHAMSPGESKRVVIELEATRYSYGAVHHPDVRGWLWHAKGVYGEQTTYHEEPSNANEIGHRVRDYQQTDVFDRDQWLFRGDNEKDHEGWTARGPHDAFKVNTDHASLSLQVSGDDGGLVSPEWTEIDPATYDELVLRTRSHEGAHVVEVYFAGEGEDFSDDRVVRFEAPGDGKFHRWVVPVGEHPQWDGGSITRLRVDPFATRQPTGGNAWWFDLKGLWAQNSSTQKTSGAELDYADGERVTLLGEMETDGGSSGDGDDGEMTGGDGGTGGGRDGNTGTPPGGSDDPDDYKTSHNDGTSVQTNSSCSAVGGGGALPAWWVVFVVLGLVLRRLRRR